MRSQKSEKRNYKFGLICEAVVLILATIELICIYLYFSGSAAGVIFWMVFFGILLLLGLFGGVVASYRQIEGSREEAELAKFRINRQLVCTLKAEKVPIDVVVGLKTMIGDCQEEIFGESKLLARLEEVLGEQRTSEVKAIIMKYAEVKSPRKVAAPSL